MTVVIKRVSEHAELLGIKALQQANLGCHLEAAEREREGFVTAEYELDYLEQMQRACPSVIAKQGASVVGYALVVQRETGQDHPLLSGLVAATDRQTLRGVPLTALNYILCGQLCVAKSHRGGGLTAALYNYFGEELSRRFDGVVTDVARDNPRSLRAHLKAGFEVFGELAYGGLVWDLVLCDWRGRAGSPRG
ncbi:MAG: GNAT family N-acetyltransferase [Pseudomonadota bacterium]